MMPVWLVVVLSNAWVLLRLTPSASSSAVMTDDVLAYVGYLPSTGLPVILSAPHGGSLEPASIPDRDAGCWSNETSGCVWSHTCGPKNLTRCKAVAEKDVYTADLTRELRERLCVVFNDACPAAILNLLDRRKFDANRDLAEATFGVPEVTAAFHRYHSLIELETTRIGGIGLFLDIHGHGHKVQRAELGYLVRGSVLDSESPIDPRVTSIRSLAERERTEFDDLLRGENSFGGFLGVFGFDSVPSPKYRGPGNQTYFNGGYNTRRHGSLNGSLVDAMQIESARSHRESSLRPAYVRALACTIKYYYCKYYHRRHIQALIDAPTTTGRPTDSVQIERLSEACAKTSAYCEYMSSGSAQKTSVHRRIFQILRLLAFCYLLMLTIC